MIKMTLDLLSERPLLGAATGLGGGLAAFLTKIQFLTPLIGFAASTVGLLVGLITLALKSKEVYELIRTKFKK